MEKAQILILCTGNSARSQMAEGFFRKYAVDLFEPFSAGLEPRPIHPMTIQVMDEAGIDIRSQRSKPISEFLGKEGFGYVIFVCKKAEENCPYVYPFVKNRLSWPFTDPGAGELSDDARLILFRQVRDQIERKIKDWIESLRENEI